MGDDVPIVSVELSFGRFHAQTIPEIGATCPLELLSAGSSIMVGVVSDVQALQKHTRICRTARLTISMFAGF